ncbi:hypothetical protein BJY52DRAFT_1232100 [Lactarius psammicola]|nr:hypothetical protein BJY52DRAFT_1232100 [Lactarius psammicola]
MASWDRTNAGLSSGLDVRVWKGGKHHDWKGHGTLGVPKKSADNRDTEIVLTGLHWHSSTSVGGDKRLITTYRHHGIQLWDVEKMTVIQSINMLSPMLGSSLSPNGLHISAAKRGGYDLYSLDSGIVLHTFAHGLPHHSDVYPSTFLPRGFVFCGVTVDGTVTLWDVKVGDRLQSVQHLCASMPPMFPAIGTHPPEAGANLHAIAVHTEERTGTILLATASHNEVRVWHAISTGISSHGKNNGQHFAKRKVPQSGGRTKKFEIPPAVRQPEYPAMCLTVKYKYGTGWSRSLKPVPECEACQHPPSVVQFSCILSELMTWKPPSLLYPLLNPPPPNHLLIASSWRIFHPPISCGTVPAWYYFNFASGMDDAEPRMSQDQVSMDETSDSPSVATLGYRHFLRARVTRSSSPRPLRVGERKRKLSGSGAQDDCFSKRLNMDVDPSTSAQSEMSHEVDNPGTEVTVADEATSELSKVNEDLRTALQEISGLHSQIETLRATNEHLESRLCYLRVLVDKFNGHANNLLPDSESVTAARFRCSVNTLEEGNLVLMRTSMY